MIVTIEETMTRNPSVQKMGSDVNSSRVPVGADMTVIGCFALGGWSWGCWEGCVCQWSGKGTTGAWLEDCEAAAVWMDGIYFARRHGAERALAR
jgi:hypothetical protein